MKEYGCVLWQNCSVNIVLDQILIGFGFGQVFFSFLSFLFVEMAATVSVGFIEAESDATKCFRQFPENDCPRPGAEVEIVQLAFQMLGIKWKAVSIYFVAQDSRYTVTD